MMNDEDFEVVRGSGNVFRDFGDADADILHMKAVLADRIIRTLDSRHLSVRGAATLTGFAAADFSRVRQAKVRGFTLDRLVGMLVKLDRDAEISLAVRPRVAAVAI